MVRAIYILFVLIIIKQTCFSQFLGGSSDGYDKAGFVNSINIYAGGGQDGHASAQYENIISIFSGGAKDGHDGDMFTNSISIFSGGAKDGHDWEMFTNSISIFSGGNKDGYDLFALIKQYIWTGAIGTGWKVAGNWLDLTIPDINSKVIIPLGVPNYPFVNAGLMSIGLDPNGGTFLCRNLTVNAGAEMTFRKKTEVENYGEINIMGSIFFLNPLPNTFQNLSGSKLTIENNGRLEFNN